ncbi:hypothetical protein LJC11_03710 [Bacteroidales bacterium OttesenSCG-928-I21]|nr:hypothetical protein [Bacteroidales bacterium OttesenSCG-928-I21]
MKDFTLTIYQRFLSAFLQNGYSFFTFEEFCEGKAKEPFVILRHDVDLKAENSLETAKIENKLGIRGSYFFRVVPQSDKPKIIKEIADFSHEIGYHYEDLSLFKGDYEKAIEHFETKLNYFRQYYPVKTICMHGSPTSKIDNRSIWQKYNYKNFGIIGEPYFDIDFNQVLYLTDTGRSWDGERYSVRDKVQSKYDFHFRTTSDIIKAIDKNQLPNQIMITTHPQRWTDNKIEWFIELFSQSVKNKVKRLLIT